MTDNGPLASLPQVRILPCGDTAIVVEFGDAIDRALNDLVLALDENVRKASPPGFVESVPTFRSLMIHYNPLVVSAEKLTLEVTSLLDQGHSSSRVATRWEIPVCYEIAHAPDLAFVAAQAGLREREVIALHMEPEYHLYMIGFLPGYPYLGDLSEILRLPRRVSPREKVPAGSVAIAMAMTAIYPVESPGGWHLIGSTPISLFDVSRTPPTLFAPGDKVKFEAIDHDRFEAIRGDVRAGRYTPRNSLVAK